MCTAGKVPGTAAVCSRPAEGAFLLFGGPAISTASLALEEMDKGEEMDESEEMGFNP